MQPSPSTLHPLPAGQQGLGWPQVEPETPHTASDHHPLGPQQQRAELAKGLVRPAGPAQMCD